MSAGSGGRCAGELRIEILNDPKLAVGQGRDAAGDTAVFGVGHVDVVAVGGTGARAFGEHHRQAAVDDVFGSAGPAGALVLSAFAALAEGAVGGARRGVGASLGIASAHDRADADTGAVLVGALHAQVSS